MRAMDAPLSVKRLLEQIKTRIEPPFAAACVVGEVSNFKVSGKHWYFTLKEEGAALACAVWGSQQRFLQHQPADGQRVILKGSLDFYVAGGSLKLIVTHCEPAGAGDLQARLRQLEAELRAQGWFDRPKRPLPPFPTRLGVVAALGGAALRDVLEVTARRAPGIHILVATAAAQGERCVPETLLAIEELQDPHWGCDALLLVRGGGSLEDLWAFNDPALVKAVAQCRIPVITGVGHEIDTTLVDLAADRRAATPSQAAELATPDRQALAADLRRRTETLADRMHWRLQGLETTLNLHVDQGLLRTEPLAAAARRLASLGQRLALAHPSGAWMPPPLRRPFCANASSTPDAGWPGRPTCPGWARPSAVWPPPPCAPSSGWSSAWRCSASASRAWIPRAPSSGALSWPSGPTADLRPAPQTFQRGPPSACAGRTVSGRRPWTDQISAWVCT